MQFWQILYQLSPGITYTCEVMILSCKELSDATRYTFTKMIQDVNTIQDRLTFYKGIKQEKSKCGKVHLSFTRESTFPHLRPLPNQKKKKIILHFPPAGLGIM